MFSRIAIFIFDGVEILDFTGPMEVFCTARTFWNGPPPSVELVGPGLDAIKTVGGMTVVPDRPIDRCLHTDLLVIPGGKGTRKLLKNPKVIDWIIRQQSQSRLTLSICTGALLLAQARLLRKREVTTHHSALDELRALDPTARICASKRFIDTGDVITAAGISAGIDAALYTVARISSPAVAERTAAEMEYDWPR